MDIIKRSGILYREWKAVNPKAILLLVHGLGAQSSRWEFLADFFLKHEISSYAIELEGFGQARRSGERPASFKTYAEDIERLYAIIEEENRPVKIFLAGESMGAVIAFLNAMGRGEFAGLICISPALKNRLHFTLLEYLGLFLPVLYNPGKLITMPFDSTMCTRDKDYIKVLEEQEPEPPRASSRLLFDTAIGQIRCGILKGRLKIPLLFLVAGNDMITDADAARRFFNNMALRDKTLLEYPGMYHSISIDTGKDKVFEDILEWLKARLG